MAITDAILAGERDPARLAALADRRIKASRATLIKALQGDWRPEHLFTLQQARQTHAHYQKLIDMCDQQIQAAIRALEAAPKPPDASSAGTASTAEPTSEDEAPSSPSTPESEPFVLSRHRTRLFGTDLTLIPGIGESTALYLVRRNRRRYVPLSRCRALCVLVESLPAEQDHRRQDHQFEDRTRHQSHRPGVAHGNPSAVSDGELRGKRGRTRAPGLPRPAACGPASTRPRHIPLAVYPQAGRSTSGPSSRIPPGLDHEDSVDSDWVDAGGSTLDSSADSSAGAAAPSSAVAPAA